MVVLSYKSLTEGSMRHSALQARDEHKATMLLSFLPAEGKKRLLLFPPPSDTADGFLSQANSSAAPDAKVCTSGRRFSAMNACPAGVFNQIQVYSLFCTKGVILIHERFH